MGLVKSKPNVFPDSVFKDPKDVGTLNICFEEAGYYVTGCVMVSLMERTYEIMERFEWGMNLRRITGKGHSSIYHFAGMQPCHSNGKNGVNLQRL